MARRMRAAWGSMAEVSPGVWRIRYWGKDPSTGEYRRRSRTVRGSRVDAERERASLMVEHSGEAPCPTVGQVWERWHLPALGRRVEEGDLSPQTLQQYLSGWRRHVAPRWADVPCDAVRPLEVQQWLSSLGANQARGALDVLRPVLDYAVRYGLAASNPARERYVMPSRSTARTMDRAVWTLPELGEVWREVMGEWFEAAFLLAAFGGLRVGEALGVMGGDVSGCHGCALVEVRRQVTNRGEGVSERLKNRQSRRAVAVPGRAGARLLLLAGASGGGWLSGDGMGGPSSQDRLGDSWARAVPDGMRHPFRNLRNSWETNARWSLGLDHWGIEVMLGHVAPGVTGRHYDRPRPDMIAAVVAEAYAAHPYDAGWDWATWDE